MVASLQSASMPSKTQIDDPVLNMRHLWLASGLSREPGGTYGLVKAGMQSHHGGTPMLR
jgi:hypothetical protein